MRIKFSTFSYYRCFFPINKMFQRRLLHTIKYAKQPQLYIHESITFTKVSFSKDPNKIHIGEVPSSADLSKIVIEPSKFMENSKFKDILHKTIAKNIYDDQSYVIEAINYRGSFMPIGDEKVIQEYMNQRPELPNTMGFVHVDNDGIMEKGTYEVNDTYTLCNVDGIIKLPETMLEHLLKAL